jgi:hypothetical protein
VSRSVTGVGVCVSCVHAQHVQGGRLMLSINGPRMTVQFHGGPQRVWTSHLHGFTCVSV